MSSNSSEEEDRYRMLMVATQAGEQDAYRELLTLLDARLEPYCRRALPSEDVAQDCVQEILLAVHRMRHTYDPKRSFFGWVYAIARNKVVDTYRQLGRRAQHEAVHTDAVESARSERSDIELLEAQHVLRRLFDDLPEQFLKPLLLTKLEGCTVEEASVELGISTSLVKVRVHRAMKRLRQLIEDMEISRV